MQGTVSAKVVSYDEEPLILVDERDRVLGYERKDVCHQGEGILHRAFSVFLFNADGRLLLQQRSARKALWPLYWSNSCCSHPRKGEGGLQAARRRVLEELGVTTELRFLFKFQYFARYGRLGVERELCSVFIGRCAGEIAANDREIASWSLIDTPSFEADMECNPERYTPWLKLEWPRVRRSLWPQRPFEADG